MNHYYLTCGTLFATIFCLFAYVSAAPVIFQDCGNGEIQSISIEPCRSQPCHFDQGSRANLTITFTPRRAASYVRVHSTLRTGGFFDYEVVVKDEDPEVCRTGNPARDWGKLQCPLVKGKTYTFVVSRLFPVSTSYNIFRYSKIQFLDQNGGVIGCADWLLQFERIFQSS